MPSVSRADRDRKRLANEADRDYPRTLARLKAVFEKINETENPCFRTDGYRKKLAREIREDVAELVALACEEQDAVTTRQFRDAFAAIGKMTAKVGLAMAHVIGSQAMKDLVEEKTGA